MTSRGFEPALICRRGHLLNDRTLRWPEMNSKHCPHCGAETLSSCTCGEPIRGAHYGGASSYGIENAPAYCHACGRAYPWTESSLQALSDLLELSGVPEAEQLALRDGLPALLADAPETRVAAVRWKRFLAAGGKQVADAVKSVLVSITTEYVKRELGI
jgi:hypothetical protein